MSRRKLRNSEESGRSYRGQSLEQRRSQRRVQLIAAAKQLFGEQGFRDTTVRQVCRAAELTERYFYESFDNLNDLFNATYDHELDRLRDSLMAAISTETASVEAMARAGLKAYYGFFKQDPQAARILLIEVYGTQHDMVRLYRRGVQDFAELIRGIIESQYKIGPNSRLDAGLLATALVGATTQLGVRWYLSGFQQSEADMVENSLAIIAAVSEKLGA